jgi:hypothetical protein
LSQNVDAKSLLQEFDSITGAHALMDADVFNDDHVYKSCLNQVGCHHLRVLVLFDQRPCSFESFNSRFGLFAQNPMLISI